ncbi:dehydration-responsive element-binding protein [Trifolium repens]|nr:dehydration-responsive element-binding protein [Trifolium repens]
MSHKLSTDGYTQLSTESIKINSLLNSPESKLSSILGSSTISLSSEDSDENDEHDEPDSPESECDIGESNSTIEAASAAATCISRGFNVTGLGST